MTPRRSSPPALAGATEQSTRRYGDAPPGYAQHRRGHRPRRHRDLRANHQPPAASGSSPKATVRRNSPAYRPGLRFRVIGMRINRPWKLRSWLPVFAAMRTMIRELQADSASGFLGVTYGFFAAGPALVQYWRSFDQLEQYARRQDAHHLPAWRRFNQRVRDSGTWASGTRPTACAPATTKRVTATCPASGWPPWASTHRSAAATPQRPAEWAYSPTTRRQSPAALNALFARPAGPNKRHYNRPRIRHPAETSISLPTTSENANRGACEPVAFAEQGHNLRAQVLDRSAVLALSHVLSSGGRSSPADFSSSRTAPARQPRPGRDCC